jgi:hypothetical protein
MTKLLLLLSGRLTEMTEHMVTFRYDSYFGQAKVILTEGYTTVEDIPKIIGMGRGLEPELIRVVTIDGEYV